MMTPMDEDGRAVTIDAAHSRDLDDAVWVERRDGGWLAAVHVADVAAAVPPGSPEDVAALARAETVYRARGSDPMLPRELAEGSLSLLPGELRGALSVRMGFAPDGSPLGPARVSVGRVRSRARLAHEDVRAALADPAHGLRPMLAEAAALASALLARRRDSGALAAYDLHRGWATTEDGAVVHVGAEASVGHMVVQELMVAANAAVARWAVERDLPVPFRNHAPAAAAPDGRASVLADVDAAVRSGAPPEALRERLTLLLGRASYGRDLRGHFGLSLAAYAHFTSPIRRYADLAAHRQVRAAALGLPPPYDARDVGRICDSLNATLRARRDAASAPHRAAAEREADRAAAAGGLGRAPDAVFERALKLDLARGAPSAGLAAAFEERSARGDLPVVCAALLFARAPRDPAWSPLRAAALASLEGRPHVAVSVLAAAPDVAPGWPAASYEVSGVGPFTAVARAGAFASAPRAAPTKKLACQLAAVSLLRAAAGAPDVEPGPGEAPPAPAAPPKPEVPLPDLDDPVSSLQTWCARRGVEAPDYDFRVSGPPHAPRVDAAVRADGRQASGVGPSKKDAKRAAATALVARMRREAGA